MMTELSLNVLDVAENSTRAGAKLVEISVLSDPAEDKITIIIKDDGCGMTEEQVKSVTDPFLRRGQPVKSDLAYRFSSMRQRVPEEALISSRPWGSGR